MGIGVAQFGQNLAGYIINVQNGLTEISAGTAEWGGSLLHDTEIVQAGFTIKFGGGTFWSEGSVGNTPTSGTGTRMMWIPAKSAFRAGFDLFDAWNDANIGSYSLAGGYNNRASGLYSFAMGRDCTAAGDYSISLGATNSAQSNGSIGIGNTNVISVIDGIAIGRNITVNPGVGLSSYAFGSVIGVSANNAMCIGVSQISQIVNNVANSIFIGVGNTGKTTPDIVVIQGGVGIGNVTAPTARLHLQAGTAAAGTAPLKLTSGTGLTIPEAGALEYGGGDLFFTPSATRYIFSFTNRAETFSGVKTFSANIILNNIDIHLSASPGTRLGTTTSQRLGFWNATPIAQPSTTGEVSGFTAGAGAAVLVDSTFTGNVGTKAYTLSDIVKHLKNAGLIATS